MHVIQCVYNYMLTGARLTSIRSYGTKAGRRLTVRHAADHMPKASSTACIKSFITYFVE